MRRFAVACGDGVRPRERACRAGAGGRGGVRAVVPRVMPQCVTVVDALEKNPAAGSGVAANRLLVAGTAVAIRPWF